MQIEVTAHIQEISNTYSILETDFVDYTGQAFKAKFQLSTYDGM
jgi:hypothetical protein